MESAKTTADDAVAISNLVSEYAHRFDAGDLDGFAALFDRGTLDLGFVPPATGADAVVEMMRGMVILHGGSPKTCHVVSNLVVSIDGTTATAKSYIQILQATRRLPLQTIATGTYHDEFTRVADVWHFTSRRAVAGLVGDISEHLSFGG